VFAAAGAAAGVDVAPNENTPDCCGAAAAGAPPKAVVADATGVPNAGAAAAAPPKAGAAAEAPLPPKLKEGFAGVDAAPN